VSKTIKSRTLAIFMVVSALSISINFLGYSFYSKKTKIEVAKRSINQIYISNLSSFHLIKCFYSAETRNVNFYKTGESQILQEMDSLSHSIIYEINAVESSNLAIDFKLNSSLSKIRRNAILYSITYHEMAKCIKLYGFDEYGYVGSLKNNLSKLEKYKELDNSRIKELKDNAKDYIFSNGQRNIDSFKYNTILLKEEIVTNNELTRNGKDSCLPYLKNSITYFDSLVILDNKIGFKNNSGLNLKLSQIEIKIIDECIILTNLAEQIDEELTKPQ
jgi:hypothetical protein